MQLALEDENEGFATPGAPEKTIWMLDERTSLRREEKTGREVSFDGTETGQNRSCSPVHLLVVLDAVEEYKKDEFEL